MDVEALEFTEVLLVRQTRLGSVTSQLRKADHFRVFVYSNDDIVIGTFKVFGNAFNAVCINQVRIQISLGHEMSEGCSKHSCSEVRNGRNIVLGSIPDLDGCWRRAEDGHFEARASCLGIERDDLICAFSIWSSGTERVPHKEYIG